jgi:valyl-tRNA synthetase
VFVRCGPAVAEDFRALRGFVAQLAGVGRLECGPDVVKPKLAATAVQPEFEAYVSREGLIDPAAEEQRAEKQLAEKRRHLQASCAKLANEGFLKRAPAEVVQQQKDLVRDLENQIRALEAYLAELRQG